MARNEAGSGKGVTKNTATRTSENQNEIRRAKKRAQRRSTSVAIRGETLSSALQAEATERRKRQAEELKRQKQIAFRELQVKFALGSLQWSENDPERKLIELTLVAFIDVEPGYGLSRTEAAIGKAVEVVPSNAQVSPAARRAIRDALNTGYEQAFAYRRSQSVA
jgi:hypothetical protein